MTKKMRMQVYQKYDGHCAYCGKKIEYKDMQVDHIWPKRICPTREHIEKLNTLENLNPSCRRCNHYKRANTLETFRRLMSTLHERIRNIYICKVAEDYGIITVKPWDGKFYFEKVGEKHET